jgi:hypothetical protein
LSVFGDTPGSDSGEVPGRSVSVVRFCGGVR